MTQASDSQIAMWRAAIAIAWADNNMSPDEKERLTTFFDNNVVLSASQKTLLKGDLSSRPDFTVMWKGITGKEDRAHLINIAAMIFESDENYSSDEKAVYEKMLNDHMASLDVTTAMEISNLAAEQRKKRAEEDAQQLKSMSRAARFISLLEEKLFS